MSAFDDLLASFERDASMFGPRSLDGHVESLAELIDAGRGPTREQGETLLKRLRGYRCFAAMLKVAKLLTGNLSAMGRIYQAQALIDEGHLDDALGKLRELERDLDGHAFAAQLPADPMEREKAERKLRSELLGLFGRTYKQRFVSNGTSREPNAADDLRSAVHCYHRGYDLDTAWHGSNLVALAWRAGREGISLGNLPSPDQAGRKLEAAQRALGPIEKMGPWDVAALAQARMAQGHWNDGLDLYRRYVRKLQRFVGDGAAFMLMGDLRQLQEIWLIDEQGEGPRNEILRDLTRCILSHPDGSVTLTLDQIEMVWEAEEKAQTLEARSRPEAILDNELNIYDYNVIEKLRPQLRSICMIRHRDGGPVGSGFLIDAQAIGADQRGLVLLTNAHVVSNDTRNRCSETLFPEQAEAFFETWNRNGNRTLAVDEVLWESGKDEYDISVCRLQGLPASAAGVEICKRSNPFPEPSNDPAQRIGTVVPIGYPGGRTLSYTFGSNPIIDHDLHRDLGAPRVVHYKADTRPGSSGGPVFTRSGDAVAVHRACTSKAIDHSPKSFDGEYTANEGVSILAAARACRNAPRQR